MKTPSLRSYSSLSAYLKDYYDYRKSLQKSFSYTVWARRLNLKSPSALLMLIQEKRLPSEELSKRLISYFNFNEKEESYFRNLILLARYKSQVQTGRIAQREKIFDLKESFALLEEDKFTLLSNWWAYAVRESVQLPFFSQKNEFLKNFVFPIRREEFNRALTLLMKMGLIEKDSKGHLKSSGQSVHTSHDKSSKALRKYHSQILKLAEQSLDQTQPSDREISGGVFPISSEKLPLAKKMIREFQMELFKLLENSRGDSLYQIEIAFFPLLKKRSLK